MLDEPDAIRRKFKRAVADSGREIVRADDKPGISNLIEIMAAARGIDARAGRARVRRRRLRRLQGRRGRGRDRVAHARARALRRAARPTTRALEAILEAGADKARAIAVGTLADVREAMGVGPVKRSVGPAA